MKIGFTSLLALLFIGLKLLGYIGWSWVWVLAPIWISFALWFVILAAMLAAAILAAAKA